MLGEHVRVKCCKGRTWNVVLEEWMLMWIVWKCQYVALWNFYSAGRDLWYNLSPDNKNPTGIPAGFLKHVIDDGIQ